MNTFLSKQVFSFLSITSLLLSFWICVENCRAEVEHNFEINRTSLQNVQVENAERDSCSVQTSPLAFFSNQELFISVSLASLPNHSRRTISRQTFLLVLLPQTEKSFVQLPFQILCQMRV